MSGLELLVQVSMLQELPPTKPIGNDKPTADKKQRTCATCMAEYSSGNWYKDKLRPGQYMCKSCYVCFNRKKKGQQMPLTLKIRQRRKPVTREINEFRSCVGCLSNHSSGDWYRDQKDPSSFNCQKCYQRKNRDKLRRKSKVGFLSEEDNEDYDTLDSPLTASSDSTMVASYTRSLTLNDLVVISKQDTVYNIDENDNTRDGFVMPIAA